MICQIVLYDLSGIESSNGKKKKALETSEQTWQWKSVMSFWFRVIRNTLIFQSHL